MADLNYKPGYNNHEYFQYLSNNENDISLLGAYHPEEIFDKYIVRVAGKGFTVVDHPSEVYGFPDTHECIDGNLPLRLVLDIDARQKPDPTASLGYAGGVDDRKQYLYIFFSCSINIF